MHRHITTAALAVTALLALTACSSSDTAENASTTPTPAPATSSAFLRPTPAQEKTLITALTAIDPGLTIKDERAIRRSVDVCDDIRTGKDDATIIKNAAYRYDGGNASIDDAKAKKIVAAIKAAYCKS
jgi:hypothetical protein